MVPYGRSVANLIAVLQKQPKWLCHLHDSMQISDLGGRSKKTPPKSPPNGALVVGPTFSCHRRSSKTWQVFWKVWKCELTKFSYKHDMKWWISNRRFINFAHKSDCCLFLWILWIGKSCALPFCPANRNRMENNETETFTKKCAEIPWWLQCRNWGPNLILSAAFKPCLGKYLGQFGTVWMHKFATKKIGGQSAT